LAYVGRCRRRFSCSASPFRRKVDCAADSRVAVFRFPVTGSGHRSGVVAGYFLLLSHIACVALNIDVISYGIWAFTTVVGRRLHGIGGIGDERSNRAIIWLTKLVCRLCSNRSHRRANRTRACHSQCGFARYKAERCRSSYIKMPIPL
jgi:hypothetical protein